MLLQPLHRQLKDENERSKAVLAIMRNAMSRTAKQREVQIVVTREEAQLRKTWHNSS